MAEMPIGVQQTAAFSLSATSPRTSKYPTRKHLRGVANLFLGRQNLLLIRMRSPARTWSRGRRSDQVRGPHASAAVDGDTVTDYRLPRMKSSLRTNPRSRRSPD
jgi:hypothetical protein